MDLWALGTACIALLIEAFLLWWMLKRDDRIEALEEWAQKVPGVVEKNAKATAQAITENHLEDMEDRVGRRFKEAEGLLLALSTTARTATGQLQQFTEYGSKSVANLETIEHHSITDADTIARTAVLATYKPVIDAHMRDCCNCYAHNGPSESGAWTGCDGCPPFESIRELCVGLRATK